MNIVILGGSGFIGSAITDKLLKSSLHTADYRITGLARNTTRSAVRAPQIRWVKADLASMTQPQDWQQLLSGQDMVINCAGALQDGLADNLIASQQVAMLAMYQAAHQFDLKLIIQISAPMNDADADLPFLATKNHADTALAESGVPYVILRPALVLGRNAHGGSALLRALAALPVAIPMLYADSPVATTAVADIATVVLQAVKGEITPGTDISLSSDENLNLQELLALHRKWLGLEPVQTISIPVWLARPVIWLADMAGKLGWHSPLRSTAMAVMRNGIHHPKNPTVPIIRPLATAGQTLLQSPSGIQDLWFARLYFLKPVIIVTLSLFWILSGLMPLLAFQAALSHFTSTLPVWVAGMITLSTCVADIGLGLLVLYRPFSRRALGLMLVLSLIYLLFASIAEPALWFDPLGSLVKVLPAVLLTVTALAILDER